MGRMDFDSSFPDPAKMIHDLNDRGMNLLLWTANRCSGDLFKEGSAKGYLFPLKWPAADIRRPEVYDWFKQKLDAYVRLGIKATRSTAARKTRCRSCSRISSQCFSPNCRPKG